MDVKALFKCAGYNLFLKHPQEKGLTYFSHMKHALQNAIYLVMAVIVLVIHSVFPRCFESTGSTLVKRVYHNFHLDKEDEKNKIL